MRRGTLVIAMGGGPTVVINQSLAGAVLEARRFPEVERIYGARHGVRGIVAEDFVDLSAETRANLEAVAATPASALGSTRDKPDLAYCRNIFAALKAHGAAWFLCIGGNDTADAVRIVSDEAARADYDLRCIHIPKTIDNDLMENDHTPGFPSAARFVAQAFIGADLDNRALTGVYLGVVMGRHAGFLTAASAAARTIEGDGPHLIYLPERDFDTDRFLSDVRSVHDRLGRCVIALSEGVHEADGTPLAAKLAEAVEQDAHGNVQLSGTGALGDLLCGEIRSKLGIKRVRGEHLRLPPAQLRRLRFGRGPEGGARGRRIRRKAGGARSERWFGSDPACRRLRGRLRARGAGQSWRQDQGDAGCVHRPAGQRCNASVPGLPAPAAGRRNAPTRSAARWGCG